MKILNCLEDDAQNQRENSFERIKFLENMLQLTPSEDGQEVDQNIDLEMEEKSKVLLHQLPLWRVQWAQYPGQLEVLKVHVPHYVDMFNRLMEGDKPWYFGHMFLPGGSRNLSNPDYKLLEGDQAPMVGTLMEITHAVGLPRGELLVFACGLQRFKVVRLRKQIPYNVADVKLIVDKEEVELFSQVIQKITEQQEDQQIFPAFQTVQELAEKMTALYNQYLWKTEQMAIRSITTKDIYHKQPQEELATIMLNQLQEVDCLEVVPIHGKEGEHLESVKYAFQGILNEVYGLNTDKDTSSVLGDSLDIYKEVSSRQLMPLLEIEQQIWKQLDYIERILCETNNLVEVYPGGLKQLREISESSYPPMKRLQRLSFVVDLVIPEYDYATHDVTGQVRQSMLENVNLLDRLSLLSARLDEKIRILSLRQENQK